MTELSHSQPSSEHTPTPWRVRDDYGGGWIQGSPTDGETYGDRVANIAKPKSIGAANAAFIVEAVNSHASLKARIEELENLLRDINAVDEHGYRVAPMNFGLQQRINAALNGEAGK